MALHGVDPSQVAPDLAHFIASLSGTPWFLNLGKPHPRDSEVVRIMRWEEWPGPEQAWGHWLGRYQSIVREHIEADYHSQRAELDELWDRIHGVVMTFASANVRLYDPAADSWYGPTACVWNAAYTACLVGWHLLLHRPIPERLAAEWAWYVDGHWPCDYAEEPPGFLDETTAYVAAGKLLVF
jgi:hypothetical protein